MANYNAALNVYNARIQRYDAVERDYNKLQEDPDRLEALRNQINAEEKHFNQTNLNNKAAEKLQGVHYLEQMNSLLDGAKSDFKKVFDDFNIVDLGKDLDDDEMFPEKNRNEFMDALAQIFVAKIEINRFNKEQDPEKLHDAWIDVADNADKMKKQDAFIEIAKSLKDDEIENLISGDGNKVFNRYLAQKLSQFEKEQDRPHLDKVNTNSEITGKKHSKDDSQLTF